MFKYSKIVIKGVMHMYIPYLCTFYPTFKLNVKFRNHLTKDT